MFFLLSATGFYCSRKPITITEENNCKGIIIKRKNNDRKKNDYKREYNDYKGYADHTLQGRPIGYSI